MIMIFQKFLKKITHCRFYREKFAFSVLIA